MKLTDLNKDMLVKLVETIQRDKQKRIDELEHLVKMYQSVVTIRRCNREGCKALTISGVDVEQIIVEPQMYVCYNCGEDMCDDHSEYRMRYFYCLKCPQV